MLYALRVDFRRLRRYSKRQQKIQNDLVTRPRGSRKLGPFLGEQDAPVRRKRNKPLARKSLQRLRNRHLAHRKPLRKVGRPRFASLGDQSLDQFDIILRPFLPVVLSGSVESILHGGVLRNPTANDRTATLKGRVGRVAAPLLAGERKVRTSQGTVPNERLRKLGRGDPTESATETNRLGLPG